jgi:hypothetical protein
MFRRLHKLFNLLIQSAESFVGPHLVFGHKP